MACSRGRAEPSAHTKLRLFADSAGYCQNPSCLQRLFRETGTKPIHIAEAAHICAAANRGPRASAVLTAAQRAAYENLLLLCPTCHTIVDKDPAAYPDSLMLDWKQKHAERAAAAFGIVQYADRTKARAAIEPLLLENRAIFDQYGPHLEYHENPESEIADAWKRKVLAYILPNNRLILQILDVNRKLLTAGETAVQEAFRQHVDDLEQRHVGGETAVGTRFPTGMETIFTTQTEH